MYVKSQPEIREWIYSVRKFCHNKKTKDIVKNYSSAKKNKIYTYLILKILFDSSNEIE